MPADSFFAALFKRAENTAKFFTEYTKEALNVFEDPQRAAAFQTALAQIAVRLANGEDFNVVITQIGAQLYLSQGVTNLFNKLAVGSTLIPDNYQQYANTALANAVIQGLMSGDFPEALQNATVQAVVQGGIAENVGFLSQPNYQAPIKDAVTGQVTGYSPQLNAAGVGVTAAVVSLVGSLLNGGIDSAAVNSALKAGVIGYASAAITTALVGTAGTATVAGTAGLFTTALNAGAFAGPLGIALGFALSYLTKGLFAPTQYIHGETVSHITQVQADGSLLLIGTRPAGSLLKTTGTTNDDYMGNDSLDDSAGHDVIVGQAGMNEIYARGGHDMMEGRAAADYIDAGTGDDHVEAGDGNDFTDGGNGNDRLFGGAGNDSLLGGTGNDQILGGTGDDAMEGQAGRDVLYGGAGNDQLIGGADDDVLDGGTGDDVLAGEAGNDEIDGVDGNDTLQGGDGNDIVAGGGGNDNLEGNGGNDRLFGGTGVDVAYGGEGDDLLDGGLENDLAFGGLGKDALVGGYGDDDLYGELGQDLLAGGAGNDLLSGGDDNDVYLFRRNDGADTVDDTSGINTLKLLDYNPADLTAITRVGDDMVLAFGTLDSVTVKGHFLTAGLAKIEFANKQAIDVAALSFNASNVGSYASLLSNQNVLASFGGAYSLYQQVNNAFNASTILTTAWITDNYDTRVTTDATERELYNDIQVRSWSKGGNIMRAKKVFYYDYYETQLKASGYADRVVGMFSAETIDGGAGNDQLYGNVGADTITGGIDHDIIFGGANNDIISGQTGNDKAFGGTGDDTLNGNEGNDTLFGEEGVDTLYAGADDDMLAGGEGNDILRGEAGKDLLYGEQDNDNLDSGDGDDYLNGGTGNDTLTGGNGNDLLFGEDGNDTLNGGAGDDIILGGTGTNSVNGGDGVDTLRLSGNFNQYTVAINTIGTVTVTDTRIDTPDGISNALTIEQLQFADQLVTLTGLFPRINPIILPRSAVFTGRVDLPAGYTISLITPPTQGSVVVNADGTYTYTAPASFSGGTSFRYRLTSPLGITNTMDAAITVADATASGGAFTLGAEQSVAGITLRGDYWDNVLRRETPQANALTEGRHLLTWTSGTKVYFQIFQSDGTAYSAPVQVTTATSFSVKATHLANGGFVLTWVDQDQGVVNFWQRYDAQGVAQTAAIRGSTVPNGGGYWDTSSSTVIEMTNGNIAVIWSGRLGGQDYDIFLSLFSSIGTRILSPVRVNALPVGQQEYINAVRLTNGNVVLSWHDNGGNDGSAVGSYFRIIASTGAMVTAQIQMNTTVFGDQSLPVITALSQGDFVATWTSPQDGSGLGIYGQRFSAAGAKLGGQFQVNIFTGGNQSDPSITALNDGGFFVVWQSDGQDTSGNGVYGRRFDVNGNAVSGEILINTATANAQDVPSVTELTNGDLVVTWRSLHSGAWQVMQKRLTAAQTYMNVVGTSSDETLIGGATADLLNGAAGDDTLMGNGDADTLTGGSGRDTAKFTGNLAQYNISVDDGVVVVTDLRAGSPDGTDTLSTVEVLSFADQDFDWGTQQVKLRDIIMPPSRTFTNQVTLLAGQTASLIEGPGQGTMTLAADGTFSITSPANFAGQTSFRYRVTAANGITWTNTVNLTITTQAAGNGAFAWGTGVAMNVISIYNAAGDQNLQTERSEILRLQNGGFVMTWSSIDTTNGTGHNTYYQVFNSSNVAVTPTPLVANTSVTNSQYTVSGTSLSDGGFALNWIDTQTQSPMWRRFNAAGVAQTAEVKVLPIAFGGGAWDSNGTRILELPNGNIGVVWAGRMGTADNDVYYSQFNASGTEIGYPIRVNASTLSNQLTPHSTMLTNGTIAVVWRHESVTYDGSGTAVGLRILDINGVPLIAEKRANTTSLGDQSMPSIVALVGGGFVVSWSSLGQDGSGYGIYAQIFDAIGTRIGGEYRLNTMTALDQSAAALTALSDGGFFAVWQSMGQDGSGYGVYGQRFNALGVAVATEIQLNASTLNNQELPDITELNNGDLMATWRSNSAGYYQLARKTLIAPSRYINAVGTQNLEIIVGGTTNDSLNGGAGDDLLIGLNGNDSLDGGQGTDVARYGGNLANYTLTFNGDTVTVQDTRGGSPDGTDIVRNTEVLSFADQDLNVASVFPEIPSLALPMGSAYTGRVTLPVGYTMAVESSPGQGSLTLGSQGLFTYQAPSGFSGATSFQYRLTTPQGLVQLATVNINILSAATGLGSYTGGADQNVATLAVANGTWDQYYRRENVTTTNLANGGYVLTWNQTDSDGSNQNIYYQVFNAAGASTTAVTRANTTTAGLQNDATVVALWDGGFALAWVDFQQGATPILRRYNEQGVAQTAEIVVRPASTGGQYWDASGVTLAELPNGGIAVLWSGRMAESDYQVYLSQYNAAGQSVGSPVKVNSTSLAGHNDLPQLITLTNGQLVAVWRNTGGADGSGTGLYARLINPSTLVMGTHVLVTSTYAGDQTLPALAALATGGFVVTWASLDTSGFGVYGQRFDANGTKVGNEFLVNQITVGDQLDNAVTALADGGFFVTWQSSMQDGSGYGVYGRRFDLNGNTVGSEILINSQTTNDQDQPTITELNNGDLIIAWRSWHGGTPQIVQKRLVAPTGAGSYTVAGNATSEIIVGQLGNDTLSGNDGNDTLRGAGGNDLLSGGAGNDTYEFSLGDGMDAINNQDAAGQDRLSLGAGIERHRVWFSQTGYDLNMAILGTGDVVTLQNWFTGDAQQVDQITLQDGSVLAKQSVEQLVNAMAGFNPQAIGSISSLSDLPSSVQTVIAASWV